MVVSGRDFRGGKALVVQRPKFNGRLDHIPTFGSPSLTTNVGGRDEDWFAGDMALNLRGILGRLRIRATGSKLKRRKALDNVAWTHFPKFKILLLVVGYMWIFLLPVKELSRGIYIDENALQPGGVRPVDLCHTSPFLTYHCRR